MVYPDTSESIKQGVVEKLRARSEVVRQMNRHRVYLYCMIYLDNNAATKLDPRVLDAMMPFLTDNFANAASTHPFGVGASEAVKTARQQMADLLGCETHELVFTSGATEAINLAIKGVAENYAIKGKHIVTVQTEHKAVLDVCSYLEKRGYSAAMR